MTDLENIRRLERKSNQIIYVDQLGTIKSSAVYDTVKRIFDFCLALVALVVLCIPMVVICILIMKDSPGSPIFSQVRLGKDEKPFHIYKFRSMNLDAEKDGIQWAEKEDARVTKVGNILRKTRLDELPQLVNILLGQMSFVGPRPERPEFYDLFDTYIVGFRQRMKVMPGLTGHAQINGGYDLLPEEKIVYDIEYIKNRSIFYDIKILFKTVLIVFSHEGAR